MTFDPNIVMPIVIPLGIAALLLLKPRRPRPVHPNRLWIVPLLVTSLIAMGLYFTPHRPFGPGAWAGFAIALAGGLAAGWTKSASVPMTWDAPAGKVVAQSTIFAALVVLGLFAVRNAVKLFLDGPGAGLGFDPGTVADTFLVFAIGLICGQRIEMFVRARRLIAGATA